jgi:hypothetical protein
MIYSKLFITVFCPTPAVTDFTLEIINYYYSENYQWRFNKLKLKLHLAIPE